MPIGDGLAVPKAVALGLLDGVRQGVAVVEDLATRMPVAAAGLLEVADDHVDLDLDGALDQLAQCADRPGRAPLGVGLDQRRGSPGRR